MTYVNNDPPERVNDIVDEFIDALKSGTDDDVVNLFLILVPEDEQEEQQEEEEDNTNG